MVFFSGLTSSAPVGARSAFTDCSSWMKMFTPAVNAFPSATEQRNRPITSDFILFGAWVYENSSAVMETKTSASVMSR